MFLNQINYFFLIPHKHRILESGSAFEPWISLPGSWVETTGHLMPGKQHVAPSRQFTQTQHLEPGYQCRWQRTKCKTCGFSWGSQGRKSLRKWMKSEPELKPRQVAVAAFYVEPTTPGEDRRWEEGAGGLPGPLLNSPEGCSGVASPCLPWLNGYSMVWLLSHPSSLSLVQLSSGSISFKKLLHLNHQLRLRFWENWTQDRRLLPSGLNSSGKDSDGQLRSHDWQLLLHFSSLPHTHVICSSLLP